MTTHQEALEAALIAEAERVGPLTVQEIQNVCASHAATLAPADNGLVEPTGYIDKHRQKFACIEMYDSDTLIEGGWTPVYLADTITAQAAEIEQLNRLVDGIDEDRRNALDLCIERNKEIERLKADEAGTVEAAKVLRKVRAERDEFARELRSAEARIYALEALLDKAVWQSIETAPRGEDILVGGLLDGAWKCAVYRIRDGFWREDWDEEPTHWMPLPAAPTSIQEARHAD